eukprot:jgi/Botrbrau1/9847/Bobra.0313s0018.1
MLWRLTRRQRRPRKARKKVNIRGTRPSRFHRRWQVSGTWTSCPRNFSPEYGPVWTASPSRQRGSCAEASAKRPSPTSFPDVPLHPEKPPVTSLRPLCLHIGHQSGPKNQQSKSRASTGFFVAPALLQASQTPCGAALAEPCARRLSCGVGSTTPIRNSPYITNLSGLQRAENSRCGSSAFSGAGGVPQPAGAAAIDTRIFAFESGEGCHGIGICPRRPQST